MKINTNIDEKINQSLIHKNRNRDKYTFANINLLGNCNADCYFCLGKDIASELAGKNQLKTHFSEWENFPEFLDMCREEDVKKLYLTGQTADGLQYKHLDALIDELQNDGFLVGVRTNGYLAECKMDSIKKMKGGIGYSIHTLDSKKNKTIMGRSDIPDWDTIIPESGPNVRVSIVLNRYNVDEFYPLCEYISKFDNVRYIQVRRISTDTREAELAQDIELYEEFFEEFKKDHEPYGDFYLAQQFELFGKEVNFWRTVETTANSLNYFTDGTCSDEYFIVEGYLKNMVEPIQIGRR
jgi:molybdenum cofactor biosynthesis enzyme MoaA